MRVFKNGAPAGTAADIDLREGTGITLTVSDESGANGATAVTIANSGSSTQTIKGNRIWGLGDSITLGDGGYVNSDGQAPFFFGNRQYLAWMGLNSDQYLYPEGFAAVAGYTTAQILATNLPKVLAAAPAACVVLGGTNDLSGTSGNGVQADTFTNLASIYTQLRAAGILPILCTVPPRALYPKGVGTLNAWIKAYGQKYGLPTVDLYSTLVDPSTGNYLAPFDNGDNLHPSNAGAAAMGIGIANALAGYSVTPVPPWLAGYNGDTAVAVANPCLLTDTNADGIPDQWSVSGTGGTFSLAADPSVIGNAWTVTRGANDLTLFTPVAAANAGDTITFACRMSASLQGAGGQLYVSLITSDNTIFARPIAVWKRDFSWHTVYCSGTVPAGKSGARVQMILQTASGAQIKIGQPTLMNLTSLGVTP